MASCKARFLLAICIIQLITVAERQVFDFLGYMWAPIIANIMHIVFVIIGCFGATQTGPKYIFTYSVWNTLWLAWNMFIICFYLEVGSLYKEKDYLNFGTGSVSWWESNGWGCVPEYATGATVDKSTPGGDVDTGAELGVSSSTAEPPMVYVRSDPTLYRERPISVKGCFMDYPIVEVAHSALQCFLAFGGIIGGVSILMQFYFNGCSCVKEDDSSRASGSGKRQSLYSIELSPQHGVRNSDNDMIDYESSVRIPAPLSPKPMTPRRVKRRSVMTRGSSGRRSSSRSHHRSSVRSSRRKVQNPVTHLLEQQQKAGPSYLHKDLNVNNIQAHNSTSQPHLNTSSRDTTPIYYNTPSPNPPWQLQGHSNPTYQQSSNKSLNEHEDFDELYNNRPASARSSYSNFHGTRPVSYTGENYFANNFQQNQATPQVPQKRSMNTNTNRSSLRSVAFLNNGPPAYNFQGHTPPDSETPM